jgi:uncharacterized protein
LATLSDRLSADLKDAMRARDTLRTSVLRMLLTRVKEKQVELGVDRVISEEQIQEVLTAFAKQRRESAEAFDKGGRADLRDKEIQEREIVLEYLPAPMPDAEIRAVLQEVIAQVGASTSRDVGRVMGAAMQRLRGRAEGGRVQALARELLGG